MRSVAEVALEMEISHERVRQLIAAGSLRAVRVGGRWVVHDGEAMRRSDGRPWSETAAWGLIWSALGRPAPWLSVKQRQRAQGRLSGGFPPNTERLGARARSDWFRAHQSALERLAGDPRLVRTGCGAGADAGADVLVSGSFEGYSRSTDVNVLIGGYGLERSEMREGNVLLRVVSDRWPFNDDERVAPDLVVALDLMESTDARTSRAGRELLDRVLCSVEAADRHSVGSMRKVKADAG